MYFHVKQNILLVFDTFKTIKLLLVFN